MTALGLGIQQAIYMASLPSLLTPTNKSAMPATPSASAHFASPQKTADGDCQVSISAGACSSGSSHKLAAGVGAWRPTTQLMLITCSEHSRGFVTLPVVNPGTQTRLKGKYLWDSMGLLNTLHTHGLHLSVATMQERSSLAKWVCKHSCKMLV